MFFGHIGAFGQMHLIKLNFLAFVWKSLFVFFVFSLDPLWRATADLQYWSLKAVAAQDDDHHYHHDHGDCDGYYHDHGNDDHHHGDDDGATGEQQLYWSLEAE